MSDTALDNFNFYLGIVLFTVALALTLFVAIKGRLLFDKAMIFIMLAYLLGFALELPFLSGKGMNVVNVASGALTQGLLYFFVFEMRRLWDMLESDSFADHLARQRRTSLLRWAVFGIFSVSHVITGIAYRYIEDEHPDVVTNNIALFDILVISRTLAKLTLDGFMAYQFILIFRNLVDRRRGQGELSRFNKIVILLTLVELCIFIARQLI